MLRIGIVAGEASGDTLGANLITALKRYDADIFVEGVGGEKLKNAGMQSLYPMDRLSVVGIAEVFGRYFELRRLQSQLKLHFIQSKPDLFIGIDVPDFNLGLEQALKSHGIKTVHYVSPSIWAWRAYRIHKIRTASDLMLNLFPFEAAMYEQYKIRHRYVGHPLADILPQYPDKQRARKRLRLPANSTIIALLPGSRQNEIKKISGVLLQAARLIQAKHSHIKFISGLADEDTLCQYNLIHAQDAPRLDITKFVGKTHLVLEAADIVLLTSGTVTLEAMLLQKPMVVAYRLSWLSYYLIKLLATISFVALPNILAGKQLVAECLQSACTPERIASAAFRLLDNPMEVAQLKKKFADMAKTLRKNASQQAACAVFQLAAQEKQR